MRTPRPGDIVMYIQGTAEHDLRLRGAYDTIEHPAIVTRVVQGDIINLHVFLDGNSPGARVNVPPEHPLIPANPVLSYWRWRDELPAEKGAEPPPLDAVETGATPNG